MLTTMTRIRNELMFMISNIKFAESQYQSQTLDEIMSDIKNELNQDVTDTEATETSPDENTITPPEEISPLDEAKNIHAAAIEILKCLDVWYSTAKRLDTDTYDFLDYGLMTTLTSISNSAVYYCNELKKIFMNSELNMNDDAKYKLVSYSSLMSATLIIERIYTKLSNDSALVTITGPIEKDYTHWMSEYKENLEKQQILLNDISTNSLSPEAYIYKLLEEVSQFIYKLNAIISKMVDAGFTNYGSEKYDLSKKISELHNAMNMYDRIYYSSEIIDKDIISIAESNPYNEILNKENTTNT